jgi:transposase InsO family protein
VNRVQQLCQPIVNGREEALRRGQAWQWPQRRLEQDLRRNVVDLCGWTSGQGLSLPDTAELLNLAPRTLRHWRHMQNIGQTLQTLGRPVLRSPRDDRQEVLWLLEELGAGVGVPTLRESFPAMPRAELTDLLRRYRRVCRRRCREALHVLHWLVPGSVWAMDFAEPPTRIDGRYKYLLAVRDLASGQQLLWLPVLRPTAEETCRALAGLFRVWGAPLVLKSDNGSAFRAAQTQALLASAGVIPLFSPVRRPQYNGSVEAGIGSLKTRTERQAARQGHAGEWTHEDVSAAQSEANETARPHGLNRPTPQESWTSRRRLSWWEREMFLATVQRLRATAKQETEAGPLEAESATKGNAMSSEMRRRERNVRRRERAVIRGALEEHGYLWIEPGRATRCRPKRVSANVKRVSVNMQ